MYSYLRESTITILCLLFLDQSSSSQIYASHVIDTIITEHVTTGITTTNLQTSTAITTVSISCM